MLQKFRTAYLQKFNEFASFQRVVTNIFLRWILELGSWNDDGIWVDTDVWKDS